MDWLNLLDNIAWAVFWLGVVGIPIILGHNINLETTLQRWADGKRPHQMIAQKDSIPSEYMKRHELVQRELIRPRGIEFRIMFVISIVWIVTRW